MKKILTALLSTAMVLAMPATIFADEPVMEEIIEANATASEIALTAKHASEYYIKLPKALDVSNDETTFSILARGDIDGAKEIVIEENKKDGKDNKLVDDAGLKADKVLTVTCTGAIGANDLDPETYDGALGTTMTIKHAPLEAGNWSGSLPITIRLANAEVQQG